VSKIEFHLFMIHDIHVALGTVLACNKMFGEKNTVHWYDNLLH